MRALLIKNAWGYVSGEVMKPEPTMTDAAEVRDWNIKDEKAKSDLILSIGASQLKLIKNCTTSRELWLQLENTFQSKRPARKATLLKSLILQKMSEGDDVREHLHGFLDTVDKLSEMDVVINPDQLAIIMLYSLPSSFENFRVAIESRDELPEPETLRTKIVEESDARKNTGTSNQSQDAMFVNRKKRSKQKENQTSKEDQKKDKSFKYKRFKCHGKRHKAFECPSQKADDKGSSRISLLSTEGTVDVCQIADNTDKNVWCLDSGCTSHICKDINSFTDISESESSKLKLASDACADVKARGVATIATMVNGKKSDVILNETLHVPELRMNLSVSKVTDKGYRVVFDKQKAEVTDQRGHTRLIAKRSGDLYLIEGASPHSCQNAEEETKKSGKSTKSDNIIRSWHRRIGHLNFRDLVHTSKSGAIRGINVQGGIEDLNCEICI
ncbi:retrovirus-related pol polyprotein from transposon tnt 1-94 [Lasius niger]|uniref:Retrovirus-related pol polyprotein from transposon tnt 1-94 n=1 Tax=Lasius niger TaxID=67767 RepID=A0A0J7KGM9_LASNI|nr:retrovirus-related pol polyprotein from transposon tnt 1-94 [Lasius niger]